MGKQTGIWLDSERAYIITLTGGSPVVEEVESPVETRVRIEGEHKPYSRLGGMYVNPQKKRTKKQEQQLRQYFRMILKKVKDADEIFVFGPSNTPRRFYKELLQHRDLAPRVVKYESEDHLTRNQMVARVRKVFEAKGSLV